MRIWRIAEHKIEPTARAASGNFCGETKGSGHRPGRIPARAKPRAAARSVAILPFLAARRAALEQVRRALPREERRCAARCYSARRAPQSSSARGGRCAPEDACIRWPHNEPAVPPVGDLDPAMPREKSRQPGYATANVVARWGAVNARRLGGGWSIPQHQEPQLTQQTASGCLSRTKIDCDNTRAGSAAGDRASPAAERKTRGGRRVPGCSDPMRVEHSQPAVPSSSAASEAVSWSPVATRSRVPSASPRVDRIASSAVSVTRETRGRGV